MFQCLSRSTKRGKNLERAPQRTVIQKLSGVDQKTAQANQDFPLATTADIVYQQVIIFEVDLRSSMVCAEGNAEMHPRLLPILLDLQQARAAVWEPTDSERLGFSGEGFFASLRP